MRLRVNCRFALAVACGLWLACFGVALGQEGERCCAVTRLDFSGDVPRLGTTSTVKGWVRSALAEKLGLTESDQLEVGDEPGRLNGHSVYTLTQSVEGLRVAHRESKLILDGGRRVSQLLGHHTPFRTPPTAKPSVNLERALAAAGMVGSNPSQGQLVFWPDGRDLRLAYEIEGAATGSGGAAFERFYIDASDGTVLEPHLAVSPCVRCRGLRLCCRLSRGANQETDHGDSVRADRAARDEQACPDAEVGSRPTRRGTAVRESESTSRVSEGHAGSRQL